MLYIFHYIVVQIFIIINTFFQDKLSNVNEDKLTLILNQFNFTCRTYTYVMMLKLELQSYLFKAEFEDSEIADMVEKLTYLETAAALLNDIAVSIMM